MIIGLKESERESLADTEGKVTQLMVEVLEFTQSIEMSGVRRIGRKIPGNDENRRHRPVMVTISQTRQRYDILEKARGSDKLSDMAVRICEDYSQEVRDTRKKLIPELVKAKNDGKRAHLRYDKLVIDSVTYKLGTDGKITPAYDLGQDQCTDELKIVAWNINGLSSKKDIPHIGEYLKTFHIIGLLETWTNQDTEVQDYLPGYDLRV